MLRSKIDSYVYEFAIRSALHSNTALSVILNGSADNIEALRALKFVVQDLDKTNEQQLVINLLEICTHFKMSPQFLEWKNEWKNGMQHYVALVRLFVEYCDARIELLNRPLADASRLLASPSLEERRERSKRFDEAAIMKYGFDGLA